MRSLAAWRRWAIWPALIAAGFAAGELAEPVLPAPHLLAPLLAGLALALTGLTTRQVPRAVTQVCQAAFGVLVGGYLDAHSLFQTGPGLIPLAVVTVVTILLSLGGGAVMTRVGHVDRASAMLGMVAGGSAAVVSTAREMDADGRVVAVLQYLRVAMVAGTAPVLAHWLLTPGAMWPLADADHEIGPVVTGGHQGLGLVLLALVALAGTLVARAVRLPSPALLGPMLLTAALTASGAVGGFAPTGALRTVLFTIIGLDIGLRFTRSALAHIGRLLPLAALCTLVLSGACGILAWLLARFADIPISDAYLATTPGGINAVLGIAVASNADVPLISGVQGLRLVMMLLLVPLLVRFGRWSSTAR
ncbi:AbrB family transcriptional regulator [Sphaerisporangium melleum]|uniref:AbrB family transcriptional regulator n=1 Tax=Sphaerisporangium melleum TaxID=321316 RepID=UPI001951D92E|nr:AbrB family transcriptional regulator [Sphaerisporangium melleum]